LVIPKKLQKILPSILRPYLFNGNQYGDAIFGHRLLTHLVPTRRFPPDLPVPLEDDGHGPGLRNNLRLAVDLDIIGTIELLAVNQQRYLRVVSQDEHCPWESEALGVGVIGILALSLGLSEGAEQTFGDPGLALPQGL
jgi:hypothetical protein|tara:strand:- start:348 stop:761 length:414 start_codon:yes stop_codon:yes gene_type:complete